jgi:uncharacterized protein
VNPIYFGSAPHSLFGVYHPPRSEQARSAGVVLCYPFGQEYMRAHRAFRQLALLLARAGFHVLRFDYRGTGDSSGDGLEPSLADWVTDAGVAADELRDTAEVSRIVFVGLRLGGAIAALAASGRTDVDEVVLWDSAVTGGRYLSEVCAHDRSPDAGRSAADGTIGVMGFPITAALQAELAELDVRTVPAPPESGRLVLASHEQAELRALGELDLAGARGRYALVPGDGNWNEVDDYGGALIPVALIQAIVTHLSETIA